MAVNMKELDKSMAKANEMIRKAEDIKIYSHIDCDGISAGAILSTTLDRLEIDHEIEFISLDRIPKLENENELTIFSDLGSGQDLDHFITSQSKVLILDHHPPLRKISTAGNGFLEVNPHHYGLDGSHDISGGGMCYLLARTFGFNDLSWIGVLSAIGDMQNNLTGKLVGLNKEILDDGRDLNLVESENDLAIYGRKPGHFFGFISILVMLNYPSPTTAMNPSSS